MNRFILHLATEAVNFLMTAAGLYVICSVGCLNFAGTVGGILAFNALCIAKGRLKGEKG